MFKITHVLIIKGPPKYEAETKQYELTLHPVDALPPGFTIEPTFGDAFLMYKDDGTITTACQRNFFQKTKKGWKRWPYHDRKTPSQAIREYREEKQNVQ